MEWCWKLRYLLIVVALLFVEINAQDNSTSTTQNTTTEVIADTTPNLPSNTTHGNVTVTTEKAKTQTPTTEATTTKILVTETPTTQAPTTQALTTQAPTTEASTTEATTTKILVTETPTTQAPTTQAPTTQAPTTQAPITQAPTTTSTLETKATVTTVCEDTQSNCKTAVDLLNTFCNGPTAHLCARSCCVCIDCNAPTSTVETTIPEKITTAHAMKLSSKVSPTKEVTTALPPTETPTTPPIAKPTKGLPTRRSATTIGAETTRGNGVPSTTRGTVTKSSIATSTTAAKSNRAAKRNRAVNIKSINGDYEISIVLLGYISEDDIHSLDKVLIQTLDEFNVRAAKITYISSQTGSPKGTRFSSVKLTKISWKLKLDGSPAEIARAQEGTADFGFRFEKNLPMSIFATVYYNENFEFEEITTTVMVKTITTTAKAHVWKPKDDVVIGATVAAVAVLIIGLVITILVHRASKKSDDIENIPYNYQVQVEATPRNSALLNNNIEESSKL